MTPTEAAGIANIQKTLMQRLGQNNPPATGEAGIVNIQKLLAQLFISSRVGGMDPPGSHGIGTFTTDGNSGPASYDPATGALNIPNYEFVPVRVTNVLPALSPQNSYNNAVSYGDRGATDEFIPATKTKAFIVVRINAYHNAVDNVAWISLMQTTSGNIPNAGVQPPPEDITVLQVSPPPVSNNASTGINRALWTNASDFIDVVPGTSYWFYLAVRTSNGQTGVAGNSVIDIVETA